MSNILDGEVLYRYADPKVFPIGQTELPISIFNDINMSCDWQKIQPNPELSPHVTNGRNMIVSISICDGIRNPTNPKRTAQIVPDWKQDILHDPLPAQPGNAFTPNPSHALIRGKKKGAVTTVIRDNSTFEIVNLAASISSAV
ncbi:hypothetical protein [Pseudomonas syringae]|uniref:hypothetical protein n=1 Tax=Pseudomonas syringae TaxID=317 RepID=UPI0011AF092A|nr:hypothetical protein [Pseudomonas syringae]